MSCRKFGFFNVQLGTGIPFGELFHVSGPELYPGIQVNAEPELFPRIPVSSSAFSMHSRVADVAHPAIAIEENSIHDMHIIDDNGEAVVRLPDYFEALNKDFRYQLTCIGGYSPVYISQEISYNKFRIAGGKPGMKISRQVTGIRKDDYALINQIEVETNKPENERGMYPHPEAFGQTDDPRIDIANNNSDKLQSSAMENNPGGLEEMNPRVRELMERYDEENQNNNK